MTDSFGTPARDPALSGPETAVIRRGCLVAALVACAYGVLGLTPEFSFFVLLPVQAAYGRGLRHAGFFAALAGLGALALSTVGRLWQAQDLSIAAMFHALLPPAVLLAVLALLNAGFWKSLRASWRLFAVGALCAAAAAPQIFAVARDPAFAAELETMFASMLATLAPKAGEGYDAAVFAASVNAKSMSIMLAKALASSFFPFILALLAASWWMGNRLSGQDSPGWAQAKAFSVYEAPNALVWPFLAAWACLLADGMARARFAAYDPTGLVRALAWNAALSFSLFYAVQGLGIIFHFFKKWNLPRGLRLVIVVSLVFSLATPLMGSAFLVFLPLLGVTELWIPYRKLKGAGA